LTWGCGLDSTGSGQGPVAGCGECGDEPSGSCATELDNARQDKRSSDNLLLFHSNVNHKILRIAGLLTHREKLSTAILSRNAIIFCV
jgi:hypothetical protein